MTNTPNIFYTVAQFLTLMGGLNWGLIGLFDFNLVQILFHNAKLIQGIYILVGLSSLYLFIEFIKFLMIKSVKP